MLTVNDPHHWAPIPQVTDYLKKQVAEGAKVLDVGPGHAPLPWATHAVDFVDVPNAPCPVIKCDLANEPLPFADKEFDFVYCRHVLEDMFNPFPLCEEMSRVGKAGYVEVPSPMAELGRGVDGSAPPYRGYHHHRFIGWVYNTELRFVSKYPFVEYLHFEEEQLAGLLRQHPKYWNTFYLWQDRINVFHRQSPLHFQIPTDYVLLLREAIERSRTSADLFFDQVTHAA